MKAYKKTRVRVRPILHLLGKTSVKLRAKRGGLYPRYDSGMYSTFEKYGSSLFTNLPTKLKGKNGRNFLIKPTPSIEGHTGLALELLKTNNLRGKILGHISLGYSKEMIYVEAIQGRRNTLAESDRARQDLGMPWPNQLISVVEKKAKENGFREIRIRVPESLYSYHSPNHNIYPENANPSQKRTSLTNHRAQMRTLYEAVAEKMGYKRRGLVYIKKI